MDMNMLMTLLNQFWGIKQKLLQLWVNPADLQNVNFNDPYALNDLASKIMPNLLEANPNIANMIKQNASMFWEDKQREVAEIIDMN
jgi:hypothetical protein